MRPAQPFSGPAALAMLAAYFGATSWHGLFAYFTQDDAGNLLTMHQCFAHSAWFQAGSALLVVTPAFRPLGGLFYCALYRLAGFHPLPFRVVCLALMLVNLWLVFFLLRRLTASSAAALLGALMLAHHPLVLELLYSSGTIYEILCFLFYFLALDRYFAWRREGPLSWKRAAALVALTGCALDSKEMAMTLPAALLLLEWVYFRPAVSWRGPLATAALVLPAIAIKVLTVNPLSNDPAYSGHSLHALLENLRAYQGFLLYQDLFGGRLPVAGLLGLWAAMAAAAFLLRSRPMRYGLGFLLVSMLPIVLIARRGGYLLYLPALGWALYASTLFIRLRDSLTSSKWLRAGLLAVCAILIARTHATKLAPFTRSYEHDQAAMRRVIDGIQAAYPRLPRGARLLLVDDPLPPGYGVLLTARIAYGDPSLEIDRVPTAADADRSVRYDGVLTGGW